MAVVSMVALLPVSALAGTSIPLPVPYTVYLTPAVSSSGCSTQTATTAGYYASIVTGFSADSNYVLGQVPATYVCGHSGRGSTIQHYGVCALLMWDLTGNLVGVTAKPAYNSLGQPVTARCPVVDPTAVYTNSAGYTAETVIEQACGTSACYSTYYEPTLITP
jgi:hypothetical protein